MQVLYHHLHRPSNKIQIGDILVPAKPGAPGEWPLKRREKANLYATALQHITNMDKMSVINNKIII